MQTGFGLKYNHSKISTINAREV